MGPWIARGPAPTGSAKGLERLSSFLLQLQTEAATQACTLLGETVSRYLEDVRRYRTWNRRNPSPPHWTYGENHVDATRRENDAEGRVRMAEWKLHQARSGTSANKGAFVEEAQRELDLAN